MKRLRGTRSTSYGSLILFRDDLAEVLQIFNPTGSLDVIRISDSEAEYDSLDEMRSKKGARIQEIVLQSKNPNIVLNLQGRTNILTLYTMDYTDEADMAFFKTDEFLRPKVRPLNKFVGGALVPLSIACVGSLAVWLFSKVSVLKEHAWAGILAGLAVMFCLITILTQLDRRTGLFISLDRQTESLSFWHRKKDDLIMLVIGAIIGSLLGVFGTKLANHFLH